jgi:glycosyltransferase involved in cell wall biosynthesis
MRILQLTTFDTKFGAAIAARRLHEALLLRDVDCTLLCSESNSGTRAAASAYVKAERFSAKVRHTFDRLPLRFYPNFGNAPFSLNWCPTNIDRKVDALRPELVHLHWCQTNFVPTGSLPKLDYPLVWTFHDMWAFTGGCHYSDGCGGFRRSCGHCPILGSHRENDLSRWIWKQKRGAYRSLAHKLHVVCPSKWMADLARQAPLLEGASIHVLPNPISAQTFKPIDRAAARHLLGLPKEGRLLLMGATSTADRRKGFDLLDSALQHHVSQPGAEPLGLVTLGPQTGALSSRSDRLRLYNLGFLYDEISLCALYNAVDVVALPSREENLSNMLSEALCCGTPGLAFAVGGNGDLITHQVNGYLAKAEDPVDLEAGLCWVLKNLGTGQRESIAAAAHAKVSYEAMGSAYVRLYRDVLAGS